MIITAQEFCSPEHGIHSISTYPLQDDCVYMRMDVGSHFAHQLELGSVYITRPRERTITMYPVRFSEGW